MGRHRPLVVVLLLPRRHREWVFYTDARTFKERYDLAASADLQGFCSWVLGKEDPAIWELLPAHQ